MSKTPSNSAEVLQFIGEGGILPVVSMSGGKDSLAVALLMRELGLECRAVFANTGWESPETYEYLETLKVKHGFDIETVSSERGNFREIAKSKAGAPLRRGRWCTEKLKLEPIGAYFRELEERTGDTVLSIVGIRAEEGEARAKMPYFEDDAGRVLDCFVWRPILHWTIEEVLAIHKKHGIPVNPLYQRGHNRVGCYPCILANKEEIRLVSENNPERIDEIEEMEAEWKATRVARNIETPGRYQREDPTFFQRDMHIREMSLWSRTLGGGKKLPLFPPEPEGGCFRWGLCEKPETE